MGSITPVDLHIDAALTAWSQEYAAQDDSLIGKLVAPEIPVAKQTDKYWIHGAEAFDLSLADRGPSGRYGEVKWAKSSTSYACDGYGLMATVDKESMQNADPQVDPARDALQIPVSQLNLA